MTCSRAALITGAAGTIGTTTARRLAAEGLPLILVDQDAARLHQLAAEFDDATAIVADCTDAAAVRDIFGRSAATGIGSLVLAVGFEGPVGPLEECPAEPFDTVMKVNVGSVWYGLKEGLRVMKPLGHGSIVVLSSISGVAASPMLAPYAASKHAVMGLVRSAAREAAPHGIRVNAVCPSPVTSPMMARIDDVLVRRFPERMGGRVDASRSVPMQRYAEPQEVADAIAYLCSDAARFCTGMAFMVDGGITCR